MARPAPGRGPSFRRQAERLKPIYDRSPPVDRQNFGMRDDPEAVPAGGDPRRTARVSLQAEVVMRRPGLHSYTVNVLDLSQQGCKIEFADRPNLDETVWLRFCGLESIPGTTCWVENNRAGIEFQRTLHIAVFESLLRRIR